MQDKSYKGMPRIVSKALASELFQLYRHRLGLTQAQLGQALGFNSKRMVQYWEAGTSLPKPGTLKNLIGFIFTQKAFLPDHELTEAQELWNTVKAGFDTRPDNLTPYPIFDEGWVRELLGSLRPIQFQESDQNMKPPLTLVKTIAGQANSEVTTTRKNNLAVSGFKPVPTSLPNVPNRLIGRENEVKAVKALLKGAKPNASPVRLLTLSGAGGTGKTRLAIQVAQELTANFEQVWFVALTPVQQPDLVLFTIVKTLGLTERPGFDTMQLLKDFLGEKRVLLLLDNFEHLLSVRSIVSQLLDSCPNIVMLITSRVVLRIAGEYEFPVAPLKVPPIQNTHTKPISYSVELANQYSALTLFVERAQAVKPSFELEARDVEAVIEICQRLDGLPLALELVAAWIKMLPPQNLLARLIDNHAHVKLKMLNTGSVDLPERQKTIRASIEWSYGLLNQDEQTLLRRLAIFTGSWELSAAEEICAGEGLEQIGILDLLYQLVTHSLVVVEDKPAFSKSGEQDEPRFRLLETIRQYGWEQLLESGELARLQDRLEMYYLKLIEEAEPEFVTSKRDYWFPRLFADIGNIRAALTWCLEARDGGEKALVALRIASAMYWIWFRFSTAEGGSWLELGLEKLPEEIKIKPNKWYAKGLIRAAQYAQELNNNELILQRSEESLSIYRALNDYEGMVWPLRNLSGIYVHYEQYEKAMEFAQETLEAAQKGTNTHHIAIAHAQLGRIYHQQGDFAQSDFHFEESFRVFPETLFMAIIQNQRAGLAAERKDFARARELLKQSWQVLYANYSLWSLVGLIENGMLKLALAEENFEMIALMLGVLDTSCTNIGRPIWEDALKPVQTAITKLDRETLEALREQGRTTTLEELIAIWDSGKIIRVPV